MAEVLLHTKRTHVPRVKKTPILVHTVSYGGWYQRTTLHLTEVYDLFAHARSRLPLDAKKLETLRVSLDLESVSRESGLLEYVCARTHSGIHIRYYEDGLYVLEKDGEDVALVHAELARYYEEKMGPAIAYIFSLGAPTAKILANIQTVHPTVVSRIGSHESFEFDTARFGEIYTKVENNGVHVYKTPQYIFIVAPERTAAVESLIEMQIFFREFKDQLEKYLNIHRTIWEEISELKENASIAGRKVSTVRNTLDGYQKTINLIENRINQMDTYVKTRSSIAQHLEIQKDLIVLFEYKFETLADTLVYVKEMWDMTDAYLTSAIGNLVEIKGQATSNDLKSLQTITSIGVISGVLGYLSSKALPQISKEGVIYFLVLFALTWILNYGIGALYKHKKYSLNFGNHNSKL